MRLQRLDEKMLPCKSTWLLIMLASSWDLWVNELYLRHDRALAPVPVALHSNSAIRAPAAHGVALRCMRQSISRTNADKPVPKKMGRSLNLKRSG